MEDKIVRQQMIELDQRKKMLRNQARKQEIQNLAFGEMPILLEWKQINDQIRLTVTHNKKKLIIKVDIKSVDVIE